MATGFLDFSIPSNLSFTVGGIEFAPFIESLSIRRPLPEITTPLAWTGEVVFRTPYPESQLPESLNDLVNPGRWAMGVHPVVFRIGNKTIARLRIMDYSFDDDPDALTGTARLGDLLTLYDTDQPAKAWQDLVGVGGYPNFAVPWGNVIADAFSAAGIPNNLSTEIKVSIPVAKDKPQGSIIKWAQQILGERGYWLYVGTDNERVNAIKYPENIKANDVRFTRPRSGVDRFKRRQSNIIPREKVVASGTTEVETVNPQNPQGPVTTYDYDENGNLITETKFETVSSSFGNLVTRTTERKALTAIDKFIAKWSNGSYSMVISKIETTTQHINAQGQVRQKTTTIESPLGVVLPELVKDVVLASVPPVPPGSGGADVIAAIIIRNLYPYYQSTVYAGSTTETWTPNEFGLVKRYEKISTKLYRTSNNGYKEFISEQELEEYSGLTVLGLGQPPPNSYTKTYRKWVRKDSFKYIQVGGGQTITTWVVPGLTMRQCVVSQDQQPPAMEGFKPDRETNSIPLTGEANFRIGNTTPYTPKREDIQFQTLTNNSEAQALAQRYGEMLLQSAYGRQINMGLNDAAEWYNNPNPFQVAAIHDGMFVLTGDTISWGEDGIEIAWDANWLGAIPTVPEE